MHSGKNCLFKYWISRAEENCWNLLLFVRVTMKLVFPWKDGITFSFCWDRHLATREDLVRKEEGSSRNSPPLCLHEHGL
jgi:hypothetical protein